MTPLAEAETSRRTGERGVVFNSVMQVNLPQIKRVSTILFVYHAGGIMARIVTKRWAKVERCTNKFGKFGELDISSTACNDS